MLQTTDQLQPAVAFSLNFNPGTGTAFSDARATGTMRAELAAVAGAVPDAVLLTSVFEWQTGIFTAFADSDAVNTDGNVYNSTDAMIEAVGGALAGGRRRLAGGMAVGAAAGGRGRRLQLFLSALANSSAFAADASREGATASFVIVAPSAAAAGAMRAALLSSSPSKDLSQSLYLLAGLFNVSDVSVGLNRTSVRTVTLNYRRSRWALVWQWIQRHIVATLAAGVSLMVALLLCAGARAWLRRRAELRARFKRLKAVTPYGDKLGAGAAGGEVPLDDPLAVASALTAKRSQALAAVADSHRATRQHHRMSMQLQLLLDPSRQPPAVGALAAAAVETGAPAAARAARRAAWDGALPPLPGLNLAFKDGRADSLSAVYTDPHAGTYSSAASSLGGAGEDVSPPAALRARFAPNSLAFRVEGDAIDELLASRTNTGAASARLSLPGATLTTGASSPSNLEGRSLLVLPPGSGAPAGMSVVPLGGVT